jgi:integrase/recombinase XerD
LRLCNKHWPSEYVIQRWQYQLVKQGISWTLFNQMVCALRFYFVHVKHYDWPVKHIPFQRRERKLPVVLNKHDINRLLAQGTLQPRSHAICATLYSTGIRLSELVNLQVKDIDSTRMLIHIRRGKGAKQRQVQLSHSLLVILRTYWKSSRSTTWLFPGNPCSKPIDTSMIQRLLDSLGKAAGIA